MWWDAGNGVGWAEAAFVIKEDVEMGLAQFLAQREGVDDELLAAIRDKIKYTDYSAGRDCECCGRPWGQADVYSLAGLEGDVVKWERGVTVRPRRA